MIRHQSSRWRWIFKLDRRSKKINKTFLCACDDVLKWNIVLLWKHFGLGFDSDSKYCISHFLYKTFLWLQWSKKCGAACFREKMDALRHTSGCNFLLHRNSICVVRQRVSWHLVLGNQPTDNGAPSAVDVPEWWSAGIINHPTHNYSEHSKLNLFHPKLFWLTSNFVIASDGA